MTAIVAVRDVSNCEVAPHLHEAEKSTKSGYIRRAMGGWSMMGSLEG